MKKLIILLFIVGVSITINAKELKYLTIPNYNSRSEVKPFRSDDLIDFIISKCPPNVSCDLNDSDMVKVLAGPWIVDPLNFIYFYSNGIIIHYQLEQMWIFPRNASNVKEGKWIVKDKKLIILWHKNKEEYDIKMLKLEKHKSDNPTMPDYISYSVFLELEQKPFWGKNLIFFSINPCQADCEERTEGN